MCVVAAGTRVAPSSLSPHVCVPCAGWVPPLHWAAQYTNVRGDEKALLDAYPDAAKAKDKVRCGRGRRVLCPLLSLLTCVLPCAAQTCRSTGPLTTTSQRR